MEKAINIVPFVERLSKDSLPQVFSDLIAKHGDKQSATQIEEFTESTGADSPVVKALRALKATNDAAVFEAAREILNKAEETQAPLRPLTPSETLGLAARLGFNNKGLGIWRREQITERVAEKPATRDELGKLIHLQGEPLDNLLARLVNENKLAKDGDDYIAVVGKEVA